MSFYLQQSAIITMILLSYIKIISVLSFHEVVNLLKLIFFSKYDHVLNLYLYKQSSKYLKSIIIFEVYFTFKKLYFSCI